jgi:hypothetical protein
MLLAYNYWQPLHSLETLSSPVKSRLGVEFYCCSPITLLSHSPFKGISITQPAITPTVATGVEIHAARLFSCFRAAPWKALPLTYSLQPSLCLLGQKPQATHLMAVAAPPLEDFPFTDSFQFSTHLSKTQTL